MKHTDARSPIDGRMTTFDHNGNPWEDSSHFCLAKLEGEGKAAGTPDAVQPPCPNGASVFETICGESVTKVRVRKLYSENHLPGRLLFAYMSYAAVDEQRP